MCGKFASALSGTVKSCTCDDCVDATRRLLTEKVVHLNMEIAVEDETAAQSAVLSADFGDSLDLGDSVGVSGLTTGQITFAYRALGDTCGHINFVITSQSECQTYLDDTIGKSLITVSGGGMPRGCSIREANNAPKFNMLTEGLGTGRSDLRPVCREVEYYITELNEACPDSRVQIMTYRECENALQSLGYGSITFDNGRNDVGNGGGWGSRPSGCTRKDNGKTYYNANSVGRIRSDERAICYQTFRPPLPYDYLAPRTACDTDMLITTSDECDAALKAIGINRGISRTISKQNWPKGCSVQRETRGIWNTHNTGRVHPLFRPVCLKN